MLYTFPHSGEEVPTPAVEALPADEVTSARINGVGELFEWEEDQSFALVPVEVAPAVSDGDITYRSLERLRLEKNIALPRAVVAALDRDRIYTLYGVLGHGAPVEFVDNNPAPQPLWVKHDTSRSPVPRSKPTLYSVSTKRGVTSRSSAGA